MPVWYMYIYIYIYIYIYRTLTGVSAVASELPYSCLILDRMLWFSQGACMSRFLTFLSVVIGTSHSNSLLTVHWK